MVVLISISALYHGRISWRSYAQQILAGDMVLLYNKDKFAK